MMHCSSSVLPSAVKVTDGDIRNDISDALIMGPCHALGPSRVAAIVGGVTERTIRKARDRETTLCADTLLNLLDVDPHIMDTLMARKGFMLVPLMASAMTDIIPAAGAAIHHIGECRSHTSPGGVAETDDEIIGSERHNDALLAAALERRAQIAQAKLRRAKKSAA